MDNYNWDPLEGAANGGDLSVDNILAEYEFDTTGLEPPVPAVHAFDLGRKAEEAPQEENNAE